MDTNETKYKVLCIIPARGGSKGLKRKNVKLLKGMPLIGWTINEANKSRLLDRIVVSTEDEEIAQVSSTYNAEVVRRPEEMASDTSSVMDAVEYTLNVLKKEAYVPDIVMLLQCTSPLRRCEHIDGALLSFINNYESADSLVSVTKEEHPPWWLKRVDEKGMLEDFINYDKKSLVRRQDFPELFRINGAIYIVKRDKLLEERNFETERTMPYIMDRNSSVDIDTEMDFCLAELLLTAR